MEWFVIFGLGIWALWQSGRIETLSRKLEELEQRLAATSAPEAPSDVQVRPAHEPEPFLLTERIEDDELVLDTPVPAASNDEEPPRTAAPAAREAPPLELTDALPPIPEAARPPARGPVRGRSVEQWITENGSAWVGGGALALGLIFAVAAMAQHAWFTPNIRLTSAAGLGVLLLGASEYLRRRPPHRTFAAALLAAAGAVAFYAAAWAAHALYAMIEWRAAAGLYALCALLLTALSFRHGETLGILAIFAAMLAPAITGLTQWAPEALTLFACAAGAAGIALAALQRWPWVAAFTLAGLYSWFAVAIAEDDVRRALALLCFASLGGVALAFRKPAGGEPPALLTWRSLQTLGPAIAICISSVAMIWTWLSIIPAPGGAVAGPAWVGAMFVALAAAAVRQRVAPGLALAVAITFLVGGFLSYLRARFAFGPLGGDFYPFALIAAAIVAISAIGARPHRRDRTLVAGAGAAGAALLTLFSALSRPEFASPAAWAPLFIGAAALFSAAWIAARDAQDVEKNLTADFWALAGAALLLVGVESLFPGLIRPAGHASVALTMAAAFAWRGWRGLRWAALAAAGLATMHALTGPLLGVTLAGLTPLWQALLVLGIAAGFLFCGAFVAGRRRPASASGETLSTMGIIMALIAAFLAIRWTAIGGAGAPLDAFTETALRTLALLVAGHVALPRPTQTLGALGALRGHALMWIGLLYALTAPGFAYNPWWGGTPAAIGAQPLLNGLALAFAVPALLALLAAHRLYARQRGPARAYAALGGVLALMWMLLEIRRTFSAGAMAGAPVGVFEGACYALLALSTGLVIALAARRRAPLGGPFGRDLGHIMRGAAWAGIAASAAILLVVRHPWWGAQAGAASSGSDVGYAVLAHALAVGLALSLGRMLSVARGPEPARFAAASAAAVFSWSFGHAATRWLYHAGAADDGVPLAGLEGFAHSLWPLAFVLAASALTERAPGRDTVRSYLHDLRALWGAAVWPALVFAPLGLWLLFNPWWGDIPAPMENSGDVALAVALLGAAACLSAMAPHTPYVPARIWFTRVAHVAAVGHLLIAITLAVRAAFNGGAVAPGLPALGAEMWTYSAVWVVFGAAVLGLGAGRNIATLRWCGLAILLAAALKVFVIDTAALSGVIRVASFLALGVVLVLTAIAARRSRARRGDLLTVIPGGPQETPHGPR